MWRLSDSFTYKHSLINKKDTAWSKAVSFRANLFVFLQIVSKYGFFVLEKKHAHRSTSVMKISNLNVKFWEESVTCKEKVVFIDYP